MLKIENTEVMGWEHAIRGMRNPMNSWEKSDSEPGCEVVTGSHEYCRECDEAMFIHGERVCPHNKVDFVVGYNDYDLMMSLAKGGPVHAKYRRMITVYLDITAPFYWWKEFDTYKVGTVANSCSTMHKIHAKEFTLEDFSCEHLLNDYKDDLFVNSLSILSETIEHLNWMRDKFLETKDKRYWWQMIQLLPTSYNQKRTVMLNYEVLHNIYHSRKNHKLDEWHAFCDWIENLPYSEVITMEASDPIKPGLGGVIRKSGPYPWGSGPNGIVRTQEEIEADRNRLETLHE